MTLKVSEVHPCPKKGFKKRRSAIALVDATLSKITKLSLLKKNVSFFVVAFSTGSFIKEIKISLENLLKNSFKIF